MSVVELLLKLKDSNIDLGLAGEDIEVNFDGDELPPGIQEEIRDNKQAIVTYLKEMGPGHAPSGFGAGRPERVERPERIPLSFAQEGLWFVHELSGSIQYHIPLVFRLKGPLDRERLARSIQEVVNRHESLRTVILQHEGEAYQQLLPASGWKLDYSEAPGEEETLHSYIARRITSPFDLRRDHLLRAELLRMGEDDHQLVMVVHHLAWDGGSLGILLRELVEFYESFENGRAPLLRELPVQYSDYAIWQRNHLSGRVLEGQLRYWKERLDGLLPLEMPTDHPRPAVQSTRGGVRVFRIPGELRNKVQELARSSGATLFMTLLAAFKVLLYRYSGHEDICVGTAVAGRTRPELEGLIGFFINMLPLRSTVRPTASFLSLVEAVKETTLEAYDHQDAPFGKVVEMLVKKRDMSRTPLFQVMFTLQSATHSPSMRLGGIDLLQEVLGARTSQYDLSFTLLEDADGIAMAVEYCTDLYAAETVDRMGGHYAALLRGIVADPGRAIAEVEMMEAEEKRQLAEFSRGPAGEGEDATLVDLFVRQATRKQEATALVFGEETMTYRQLDERSNRLAHHLRKMGVKEDTPVAICLRRSPEMIVAIFGVLKAGGCYVPVDVQYPAQRIDFILQDTGAPVLITESTLPAMMDGEDSPPVTGLRPDHLAYIIYTSGSTGQPKGVMIEHRNLVNLLFGFQHTAGAGDEGPGLAVGTFVFDASVWEFFINLCFGHTLHLIKEEQVFDPAYIGHYLIKNKISTAYLPPTLLAEVADHLEAAETTAVLRRLLTGVLPIKQSLLQRFCDAIPGVRIVNGYGPTEATICASYFLFRNAVSPNAPTPIGRPIANYTIYILDAGRRPVPVGIAGEVYIGGAGLARGYFNREELTAEKFIADPFAGGSGARLYRTGDRARWLADGMLEFLGRADDQVKIRGYRIEPGEIESCAVQSGLVKECIVVVRKDGLGLTGYVVTEKAFDRDALLSFLRDRLPSYMIPEAWVPIDRVPLTANGKIDKKALPVPDMSVLSTAEYVAPRNKLEKAISGIWQQLLGVDQVGIRDNFFELGGNSLLVLKLVSQLQLLFDKKIGVLTLFQYPSIRGLLDYLKEDGGSDDSGADVSKEELMKELAKF